MYIVHFRRVKKNEFIVHLQEAIGHNSIPVLIFLTQLPEMLIDIKVREGATWAVDHSQNRELWEYTVPI